MKAILVFALIAISIISVNAGMMTGGSVEQDASQKEYSVSFQLLFINLIELFWFFII